MATKAEAAQALRDAMRRLIYEKELPGYMGIYTGSWVYDTSDGRKWVRVLQGGEEVPMICVLLDDNIADDYTQAVWVKFMREGRWAITRKRIEGY